MDAITKIIETGNPSDIAQHIFRSPPCDKKQYMLTITGDDGKQLSSLELFEVFMTILIEGIYIRFNPTSSQINFTNEMLQLFDENVITNLNPWLNSLGISVSVETTTKDDKQSYEKYYCKTVMKCDKEWETFFDLHPEITKDYHFILGGKSPYALKTDVSLNNLFAIFIKQNIVYKISFKLL